MPAKPKQSQLDQKNATCSPAGQYDFPCLIFTVCNV